MRKIKAHVSIGLVGCVRDFTVEVHDDADDDEINDIVWEYAQNFVSAWYDDE